MPCLSETVMQAAWEGIQVDLYQQFMGVIDEYNFRADLWLNYTNSQRMDIK